MLKSLIATCISLALTSTQLMDAAPQGSVEGHLTIVWARAVGQSDEMPRPEVAPESYSEYPLVILSKDTKKEIARVTPDENGNYRVSLPPGAYILDLQGRGPKRLRTKPQEFTVTANQTVRVDMSIVIGFAKGKASAYSG
jgi:hypothetical protein